MAEGKDQRDKRAGIIALLEDRQFVLSASWCQAHFLLMGV